MKTNDLDAVLAQFKGKSADDIAAMIQRRGIKGRMGTTYGCPVALLLDNAFTGGFVIGRRYIVRRSGDNIEKSRTPENVGTFLRRFDIGKYPEIIAPPPRCMRKPGDTPKRKRPGDKGRTRPPIKNHLAKLVGRFHDAGA